MIEYYTVFEVTKDEGSVQLLINIRYTVIVAEPDYPIRNIPQSTSLVFFENNVRDSQYKIDMITDHFTQQDNASLCTSIYFIQKF